MSELKNHQKISTILYIMACIFLILGIYIRAKGIENRPLELSGWMSLLVAACYGIYVNKLKKDKDR